MILILKDTIFLSKVTPDTNDTCMRSTEVGI